MGLNYRNSKRSRNSSRTLPLLSAILLESIALIAVVAVARPDLLHTIVSRVVTSPFNEAQVISETPYTGNIRPPQIALARPQTVLSNQTAEIAPNLR